MRAFALLLGITLTTSGLHAQGPATVSGVVTDENRAPVREALVVIDPDSLSMRARTGVDGRYRIGGVPNGRYEVRVVRIGFRPVSRTIEVNNPNVQFDVTLQSIPIPLDTVAVRASRPGLYGLVVTRGISLLPHEPRVLRNAQVQQVNGPHSARTGPDGRFGMPQFPAGSHAVTIALEGYLTRLVPVSVDFDGGVEITVTLDSLYAEYHRREEDQMRGIGWRTRRATSPATFVTQHELDLEAKGLRDALRYAPSMLNRGVLVEPGCIYLNGVPRPDVALPDISPADVASIEVYPRHTLEDHDRLPDFPRGGPCDGLWGVQRTPLQATRGRATRVPMRLRGNQAQVYVIWTRGRQ